MTGNTRERQQVRDRDEGVKRTEVERRVRETTERACSEREGIMETGDEQVRQVHHRGRNKQRLGQEVEGSDGEWRVGGRDGATENNKRVQTEGGSAAEHALQEGSKELLGTDEMLPQ